MPYPHMPATIATTAPYLNGSGSTATAGMPVYLSASSTFSLALASSTAAATAIGIVSDASIASGAIGNVVTSGPVTLTATQWLAVGVASGTLVVNQAYYVSSTSPGMLTTTAPAASLKPTTFVGIAISATEMYVGPQVPIVVGTPLTGVTADASSGKLVPATELELDTLLAYCGLNSGGFRSILNMQDSSSPLVDANGNSTFAITATGIPHSSYRNVIPGWSRLALGLQNASVDIGFVQQHGNLPDPSTHSYLMMCWVEIASVPTTNQGLISINDGAFYIGVEATTCRPIVGAGGSQQSRGNVALPIGTPFLLVFKYDNANKVIKAYTPYEIIGDFWTSAPASGTAECDFGVALASGIFAANSFYLWGAMAAGTSAEIKDANVGLLGTTMGQTYSWYSAPVADASGIYNPITPIQFAALKIAPASNAWPLQETSGILAQDTTNDCVLVAQAGITMGHASLVANRVALATTDGTTASYASNNDARLPNPANVSVAMFAQTQITAAAHGTSGTLWSWLFGMQSSQYCSVFCTTAGVLGIYNNALGTPGSYNYIDGARHPLLLIYNLTSGSTTLYTDKEIIAGPTFAAQSTFGGVFAGSFSGSVPAAGQLCDHLELTGGQAAEMNTAQARAYLNKRGWSTVW